MNGTTTHDLGEHARKLLDDLRADDYAGAVGDVSTILADCSDVVDGFLHPSPPAVTAPPGQPPDLRQLADDLTAEANHPRHRNPQAALAKAAGNRAGQPVGAIDPAKWAKILEAIKTIASLIALFAG